MRYRMAHAVPLALVALVAGCGSPVTTAAKLGMRVVGNVVSDAETQKLAGQLVGQPPSAADQALGERVDTFQDVKSTRQWVTYPVKMDLLGSKRYVVGVADSRIVAVEMVEKESGKINLARRLIYLAKVKGKGPAECETALGLGPPLLTVRSRNTGALTQLYDSRMVKELQGTKWCILRYDNNGLCEKVDLVDVHEARGGNAAN